MKRDIAEQIFCKYLFNKGIIGGDDDLKVRRLDFGQNWTVIVNGQHKGNCDYDARANRFIGFKPKFKRKTYHKRKSLSVIDYLKANKKIQIMG